MANNCNDARGFFGCGSNPCRVTQENTAACESLPSQISNFTAQFFGEVIKTETDGVVSWSLPCGLDVGLPNNPRAAGEGLACYFLRLFEDGILGLTGPKGDPGKPGCNGNNAYTVTLSAFIQPSTDNPNIQVATPFNPAILSELYVFIQGSGWYFVDLYDVSGTAFLTLALPVASAVPGTTVSSGKILTPAGFPGATGIQGIQGEQGTMGESFSNTNAFVSTDTGTDYVVNSSYNAVDFISIAPRVLLPKLGVYMLTAVLDIKGISATIASTDEVTVKLRDTVALADVPGSEHTLSRVFQNQRGQLVINAIYTSPGDGSEVGVYATATSANLFSVIANHSTLSMVRLA